MSDKNITINEMIEQCEDGMTIGIGGWGSRRKPMALVRALLRSSLRDLTIVSYGGLDVGMLCAAQKIKKLIFGFVSLDVVPLDPHFRAARQAGAIEIMELDEGLLQWGLKAAAMNLPFLPSRVGLGTDVERLNPMLKRIKSPYGGETLLAMPALALDVALIHVNVADKRGNNFVFGADPYFDAWLSRAAKKTFATCEKLEPEITFDNFLQARTMLVERFAISGIAEAPFGAHPTFCSPHYGIDSAHIRHYAAADTDWHSFYNKFVALESSDDYIRAVGGAEHLHNLPQTPL